MKQEITVPSKILAAAMMFSGKNDVRHYLNGVRIGKDRITATNGHVMFDHNLQENSGIAEDKIIAFKRSIPASSCTTKLLFVDDHSVAIKHFAPGGKIVGLDLCAVIDGKYPDADSVLAKCSGEKVAVESIMLNTEYVLLVSKAAKKINRRWAGGKFCFYGRFSPVRVEVECNDYGKSTMIIMPMAHR